nr:ABC transporter G family member 11-like [Ipomoea batatas]
MERSAMVDLIQTKSSPPQRNPIADHHQDHVADSKPDMTPPLPVESLLSLKLGGEDDHIITFSSGSRPGLGGVAAPAESPALELPIEGDDGIHMTWKAVGVTQLQPNKKSGCPRRNILEGVTGYVQPGEALAVMGPSGSGKSTLLNALAGRLDSNTTSQVVVVGEILVNGRSWQKLAALGITSVYVAPYEFLIPTLTVREAVYYSAQLQLPDSMSRGQKRERAEATIREMGLQDAMNTRIGRGLSRGQKRRVSICIQILTRPNLLFLEDPTSGLDGETEYNVINNILRLSKQDGRAATIIASFHHQPSPQLLQLFNNLCLLSSGRTVYFGKISKANEFIDTRGFNWMNLSRYYQRIKDSDDDAVNSENTFSMNCPFVAKKERRAAFGTQCAVLTKRSFLCICRELEDRWRRFLPYIALCLSFVVVSSFVGHDNGSIQDKDSMLKFVGPFLIFMAIGGFPSFVEDMKVFIQERQNGHYGVGAFVVGKTFSSIPYLIFISFVPGGMAYYLILHLQRRIEHFAYFVIMLFSILMLNESLMMIVAIEGSEIPMGIIAGIFYPIYYIVLHKYAYQGLYKNQSLGLQASKPPTPSGDNFLKSIWIPEMGSGFRICAKTRSGLFELETNQFELELVSSSPPNWFWNQSAESVRTGFAVLNDARSLGCRNQARRKKASKAPQIQRLVITLTLQRKRARIAEKKQRIVKAKTEAAEYQKLLASRLKEQRERCSESLAKKRSRLSAASKPSVAA